MRHVYTTKMRERQAGSLVGVKLLTVITKYKGIVSVNQVVRNQLDSHLFLRRSRSFMLNFYKQYMGPLGLLEHKTLLEEVKDQFI
jgi:hypothetical protein